MEPWCSRESARHLLRSAKESGDKAIDREIERDREREGDRHRQRVSASVRARARVRVRVKGNNYARRCREPKTKAHVYPPAVPLHQPPNLCKVLGP